MNQFGSDHSALGASPCTNRRAALRALGGAAVALLAMLGGGGGASARKRRQPRSAFTCPAPAASEGEFLFGNDVRAAQIFTAGRSGTLRSIRVGINKPANTTGDYVVQLLQVVNDVPSNLPPHVLAAVTVSDATVPEGEATLTANFGGTRLVQGTEYAAAVSRLGNAAGDQLIVETRKGTICAGQFFFAADGNAFNAQPALDMVVSVFVA